MSYQTLIVPNVGCYTINAIQIACVFQLSYICVARSRRFARVTSSSHEFCIFSRFGQARNILSAILMNLFVGPNLCPSQLCRKYYTQKTLLKTTDYQSGKLNIII